jgi:hypothetical protein
MWGVSTVPEKSLAFVHDTTEQVVDYIGDALEAQGSQPLSPDHEIAIIDRILRATAAEFTRHYIDMPRQSLFIGHLEAITKLSTEKGWEGYQRYGYRMAKRAHDTKTIDVPKVKRSDGRSNRDPDRNPPKSLETDKDIDRIRRYVWLDNYLAREFPSVTLRPIRQKDQEIHNHRQKRLMQARAKDRFDHT